MKIRDRLENMLIDKGFTVDLLWGVQGQWRKTIMDVMRWEANCHRVSDGMFVHVGSWSTMTECVRRGFDLEPASALVDSRFDLEAVVRDRVAPPKKPSRLAVAARPR